MELKKEAGFTLIEILVYIGLFSLVMGGSLFTIYVMIQGQTRLQNNAVISEEAVFILRKLDWALTGASNVYVPASNWLEITKPGLPAGENPLIFKFAFGGLTLARGSGSETRLNNPRVEISSLVFTEIPASGAKPAALMTQLTLTHFTESRDFETTKYLRK